MRLDWLRVLGCLGVLLGCLVIWALVVLFFAVLWLNGWP